MKKEQINELFTQFEAAKQVQDNIEYWSARDMQNILGYAQWKNFEKVIDKAKLACKNAGVETENHSDRHSEDEGLAVHCLNSNLHRQF